MTLAKSSSRFLRSLSARRAWIEIIREFQKSKKDRVALRKESVDRNRLTLSVRLLMCVALRKESVDRNLADDAHFVTVCKSLSARRAWIEMSIEEVSKYVVKGRSPQGERG